MVEVLDREGSEGLAEGLLGYAVPWSAGLVVAPQGGGPRLLNMVWWLCVVCSYTHPLVRLCFCSYEKARLLDLMRKEAALFVMNKIDLIDNPDTWQQHSSPNICWLSCKTGHGVDGFMSVLQKRAAEMCEFTALT